MQRRLAAIMVADVVGSSRLIEADEQGALSAMRQRWSEIVEPLVKEHAGRIVKFMGDGLLAEFASAVKAVECGLAIQERMARANEGVNEARRIVLRIGINVGDVVEDAGDVYGDGVNVAARIEAFAEPGGLCITGNVQEAIRGKVPIPLEDWGEKELKNIARPVRLWRVAAMKASGTPTQPVLALPAKPSIVVLPFTNMSGDPEQEFFADGITEDIITALSRIGDLFVISRNSSFAYKGKPHRVTSVARELGVQYVLEGSVRKAGQRLRITAQLIDGMTDKHIWAERYDENLEDVFDVQDRITKSIAEAMQVKLTYGEFTRLWDGQTKSLAAWEKLVMARHLLLQWSAVDTQKARALLEDALRIDPAYAGAVVLLGLTHWSDARFNIATDKELSLRKAEELASKALEIDPTLGSALMLQGICEFLRGKHSHAVGVLNRAIELSPSDSWVLAAAAMVHLYEGSVDVAYERIQRAFRLSPYPPAWYYYVLALVHLWQGDLEKAETFAKLDLELEAGDPGTFATLATVYCFQGQMDRAKAIVQELRAKFPEYGLRYLARSEVYAEADRLEKVLTGLRAAGLPE